MTRKEYDQIIRENFDLSDDYTRKYIVNLEDANQSQLLSALSSALYDKIVSNVDKIDFGSIPMSRGDIDKVEKFNQTLECLDIMNKLVVEYKQKPTFINEVLTAIYNIRSRKAQFIKGYSLNVEFPMMIYNLIVLSIERSVSLLIATCIEYVKDPSTGNMKMAFDKVAYKKTEEDLMFKQIENFNSMCKTKTFDKLLDEAFAGNKAMREAFDDMTGEVNDMPVSNSDEIDISNVVDTESLPDPFAAPVAKETDEVPEDDSTDDVEYDDEELGFDIENDDDDLIDSVLGGSNGEVNDNVEPQNIPSVAPGDSVEPTDRPINEDPVNEGIGTELLKIGSGYAREKINQMSDEDKKKIKNNAIKIGAGFGIAFAGVLFIKYGLAFLKNMVYGAICSSIKLSEYLEIQAQLLQANADNVENNENSDLTPEQRRKVAEKQRKWADRFSKWSNIFALDRKTSQAAVKKMNDEDDKEKRKIENQGGNDVLF